ncbi:FecCD family ABC transporter permease [Bdellovibrio sp. HCB209]|uniref:FecCD family ABC transporter permease n=1 Tax=Bdellovibrio sp. HCB209 TaxID=3394354 RepID=UPI0039B53F5E
MTLAARKKLFYLLAIPFLVIAVFASVGIGAVEIAPMQVLAILGKQIGMTLQTTYTEQQEAVLMAIRLPRVVLGLLIGSGLAMCGAAMQGLFRNPLADPGLLGISSGASLFVAGSIVLQISFLGLYTLPVVAFIGSITMTSLIYALSQHNKVTNVSTMLLAGIAINAICGSGTGLFTFLSTDEQLRTITFWQLGSLGGATWTAVTTAGPFILIAILILPFMGSALNALLLGENNARHLGIPVERVKWILVALISMGVGAGVAVAGMIGFVGLVVPHFVRLFMGPNHKSLLPASALLGAGLLLSADLLCRTMVSPLELPIGILTSLLGAPVFLSLLLKSRRSGGI